MSIYIWHVDGKNEINNIKIEIFFFAFPLIGHMLTLGNFAQNIVNRQQSPINEPHKHMEKSVTTVKIIIVIIII